MSNNNINNIIKLHEEKIKSLLKKVHQLDELNIRTGGHFSSLTGKYHPGPLASIDYKQLKRLQIEREIAEKMLDLQWKKYCEMKGGELII